MYNNYIENFSWGIMIDDGNTKQYYPPIFHIPNQTSDQATDFHNIKTVLSEKTQNSLIPRVVNIYHNNFVHNKVGAHFEYKWISYLYIISFILIGLEENEIVLPRPLVGYHFYENYWDDKSADKSIYKIKGVFWPFGPLWLLF